jgi:hypothetical protein
MIQAIEGCVLVLVTGVYLDTDWRSFEQVRGGNDCALIPCMVSYTKDVITVVHTVDSIQDDTRLNRLPPAYPGNCCKTAGYPLDPIMPQVVEDARAWDCQIRQGPNLD